MELLEAITNLITRYRVREEVFRCAPATASESEESKTLRQKFVEKTTELYADILSAQVLLACKFARSSFVQYFRDLVKFDNWKSKTKEIVSKDDEIKEDISDLDKARNAAIENALRKHDDDLGKLVEAMKAQVQHAEDEKKFSCLSSLSSSGLEYRRCKDQIADRVPGKEYLRSISVMVQAAFHRDSWTEILLILGWILLGTFDWFLTDDKFKQWQATKERQMMFLTADAGCGKSVLLKSLVDDELATCSRHITCYFFFRRGVDLQESALEALCAILHQLYSQAPHLIEYAIPDYNHYQQTFSAQFALLWDILLNSAKAYHGEILCVLDGLDECAAAVLPSFTGKPFVPRKELTDRLAAYRTMPADATAGEGTLKFLVSARTNSGQEFRRFASKDTVDNTVWFDVSEDWSLSDKDLKLFVDERSAKLKLDPDVRLALKQELIKIQSTSRTYLWLSLVMDILTKDEYTNRSAKFLTKFLNGELPESVDDAFERVLPGKDYEEKARLIFHIMFAARRSLTVQELNEALKFAEEGDIDPGEDLDLQPSADFGNTLATYCGSFITIARSGGDEMVSFFHEKAREFLLHKDPQPIAKGVFRHAFIPEESSNLLRKCCVAFLKWRRSKNIEANIRAMHRSGSATMSNLRARISNYLQAYIAAYPFMRYAAVHWIFHLPFDTKDQAIRKSIAAEIALLCEINSLIFRTWFLCCWELWWPEGTLKDFFEQYIDGWTGDHLYPDHETMKAFSLRGEADDEDTKWWFWTLHSDAQQWKDIMELCEGADLKSDLKSEYQSRDLPTLLILPSQIQN